MCNEFYYGEWVRRLAVRSGEHIGISPLTSKRHSVHLPPQCRKGGGGGGEPPTKFSKKGGLTGPWLLEGVAGKEGGDFFQVGCNFHIKNKLKSEIFNEKKGL